MASSHQTKSDTEAIPSQKPTAHSAATQATNPAESIHNAAPSNPTNLVIAVGSTIGLSIMGDSLLYSILPLEAANLGISLPQVGILLSANRLIRLFSNTWASSFYERLGPRTPFIGSALLGVAATVLYGMGWGFFSLLLARIIWGIGWSALRQGGYEAIWTGGDQIKGRLSGLLWGLIRLGSATGVLVGGYLYDGFGFSVAIGAVIAMAILAVPVSALIRWPQSSSGSVDDGSVSSESAASPSNQDGSGKSVAGYRIDLHLRKLGRGWLTVLEGPVHRWLLGATFCDLLLNSVVLATTSLFLADKLAADQSGLVLGVGIATITGILHGVRWLANLAVGPALGHLSDQWGQPRTALILVAILFVCLAAAITLPTLFAVVALSVAFLVKGSLYVVLSAAATGAATQTPRPHLFMSTYATASDVGSAIGPLFAFSIAGMIGLPVLYLGLSVLSGFVIFRYWLVVTEAESVEVR